MPVVDLLPDDVGNHKLRSPSYCPATCGEGPYFCQHVNACVATKAICKDSGHRRAQSQGPASAGELAAGVRLTLRATAPTPGEAQARPHCMPCSLPSVRRPLPHRCLTKSPRRVLAQAALEEASADLSLAGRRVLAADQDGNQDQAQDQYQKGQAHALAPGAGAP